MESPHSLLRTGELIKGIRQFYQADKSGEDLLKQAITKLGLSARVYDRISKVARTIGDLAARGVYFPGT